MKKLLFALFAIFVCALSVNAEATRWDFVDSETVYHPFFAVAQYQIGDFDMVKESSCYGLGMVVSSISHWGAFHVGANVNFSINAGLVDDWGCIIDFGPSIRYDISKHAFINMPINAVCICTFPEGTTSTETTWGAKIAPSIHAFLSDRFGVFAGPKFEVGFESGSEASFGVQAGISYCF